MENKIKNLEDLKKIIFALKAEGKKIVFTNGCFDLVHYGHVKYLQEAKKKGDILIVGINSDTSIKRIKGNKRPITNQKDRLRVVAALESVDFVALFNENTPSKIIKLLMPNVLVKGADWNKNNIVGKDTVLGYGGCVYTIKLLRSRSTTNLIKKIAKLF